MDSSTAAAVEGPAAPDPGLELRLLGGLRIRSAGIPLSVGGHRQSCVLAVLLLNHGRIVSRADLAEWAWPSLPPSTVDRQLANYVSALRRALEPAGDRIRLLARRPGFTALIEPGSLDVERFTELAAQARAAWSGREHRIAADRLGEALGLCQGPPLNGLETPYLRQYAQELEARRRDATALLAELELEAGRPDQAVALLRDLAAREPEHEAVGTTLVRALTAAGQSAEAARTAARAEHAVLQRGRTPTPELRRAHSDALAGRTPRAAAHGPRRQLPTDTGAFTGREPELAELVRLADQARLGRSPGAAVICALDGMAGVGKTALAVHAGHLLLDRFPDGQLFVDLRGYTQGMAPSDPADALATVLQALGVAPQRVPAGLDDRAALYRDRLAGTSTLIVLDNAANEAQVRPLLPASGRCFVLVTSRKQFKGLDDAQILPLDVLPDADARALFREVAGPGRTAANDPLLDQVVALCGRLPLALRIAAALIRASRAWNLQRLADQLSAHRPDAALGGFTDGERNLTTVFDLSLHTLPTEPRRLFRLLGLVPGPDVDAHATAALLDADPDRAEDLLQDLVDHNLLAEPAPGRYRMHDLLRRHARALATGEPRADGAAALERLLDHYQHTAARADALIARFPRPEPPGPGPAHPPALPDQDTARGWLRAERANLFACLDHVAAEGEGGRVIALSAGLASLLRTDGPWSQALAVHSAALTTAARLEDLPGQAGSLDYMGAVRLLTGDYPGAARDLEAALGHYRELGDRRGQAGSLTSLGAVRLLTGDFPGATEDLGTAVALSQDLGDRLGQAHALTELGVVQWLTGDLPGAARVLATALELYQGLGDRRGQANALIRQGAVRVQTGERQQAMRDLEQGLELHRDLGERLGQAHALTQLGTVRAENGDHPGSAADLEAALGLYRDLGDRRGQANALTRLGAARTMTGDHPAAAADLEAAVDLYREIGSPSGEAWALNHHGALLRAVGDLPRAAAVHGTALTLAREVRQPDDEALALEGLGECLLRQGARRDGEDRLTEAMEIHRRLARPADVERLRARLVN